MNILDPEKLHVEIRNDVTDTEPVFGRKYTLTHSDQTAELFLTISMQFAYEKVTVIRDELLAEWTLTNGIPYLYVHIYLNGMLNPDALVMRDEIFRRELPLALEAIRYGDRSFFDAHPDLDNAEIWVQFYSENPAYNRFEFYGLIKDYK